MKARLLLLSCCAPCSCAVIEKLALEKRDFAVLFYNPNIMPEQEYQKRKIENKKVCLEYGVSFTDLDYEHDAWRDTVRGLENEPERGARCGKCFLFRLERAALFAKENGFTAFSSVLGVSKYKDFAQVNAAAKEASEKYGVPYDYTNWRKGGLEERRQNLTKEKKLYSQTYCGCFF